jgi:tetratricopeptide (TPR) repeat protein
MAACALGQTFEDGLRPTASTPFQEKYASGYAKLRQGNFPGAIRDLRAAPDALHVRKTLAAAYYAERQYRLFEEMMRQVISEAPEDFAPYYYLGRHYDTDLRDFRKAASFFESAAERNRAHAPSYYYLGFCLEQLGELERSAKAYEQARTLRRDYALPWIGLARLRLTAGEADLALPLAREAVRLSPADAAANKLLARALAAAGKNEEAAEAWKRVADLDTTDAAAVYHLYRDYLAAGDKAKAEQARLAFEELRRIYGVE